MAGLADPLRALGIPVFGHGAATAQLEGSKAFSKAFMARHGIPCAQDHTVTDFPAGEALIRSWPHGYPIVLKADGLAAGKGVVLATSEQEALATLRAFLDGQFGEASRTVVLEEPLVGMELSLHVLVDVDGDHAAYAMLPPCQDHKRIFDGDQGPNTGGMGAFGPHSLPAAGGPGTAAAGAGGAHRAGLPQGRPPGPGRLLPGGHVDEPTAPSCWNTTYGSGTRRPRC